MSSLNLATSSSSSSLQKQHPEAIPSQPFESLPDELLLLTFDQLNPFKRAQLPSTCKKWNQTILLHRSFWQYLNIPEAFPLSSIVRILSIFNSRSQCNLRHVVIQSKLLTSGDLEMVFEELKRSANSLKVVAIAQDEDLATKTRELARESLPLLDSLITLVTPELLEGAVSYAAGVKESYGVKDQDVENPALKFYCTNWLIGIGEVDLEWFSKLIYLEVTDTDSFASLVEILQRTPHLVELDLRGWEADEEILDDMIQDLSHDLPQIRLRNLAELTIPISRPFTLALNDLLEIDGEKTILVGSTSSLLSYNVVNLKSIQVHLSVDKMVEEQGLQNVRQMTESLLRKHQFVEQLCLESCFRIDCPTGGQRSLNLFLELLCEKDGGAKDVEGAKGRDPNSISTDLFLPHLVSLTLRDPILLDGELLLKLIKTRREFNRDFSLYFLEGENSRMIEVEDWKAMGWMKE